MTSDDFKKIAFKAAKAAGKVHLQYLGNLKEKETKSADFDFATKADKEAEKKIIEIISNEFPEHGFLAEESGLNQNKSDYLWVIDPLDGTTNFFHGYPFFCVSIALKHKKEIILGVVFDPVKNELFHAEKNKGAFLNGEKIMVSNKESLNEFLCTTGFAYERGPKMKHNLKLIEKLLPKVHAIRRDGAAALDLAYIAAGRLDAYWEWGLKSWDIAAGLLIIEEAGGIITNERGEKLNIFDSFIFASNGKQHEKLADFLGFKG